MEYTAVVAKEGKYTLAEFPDCPGCQTFAEEGESIETVAQDALTGWLASHLARGVTPPRPRLHRQMKGSEIIRVPVPPVLGVRLELRWAREDANLTQADLARSVGISQQQVAKLEGPDANPTLDTLQRVARGLGRELHVSLG